MAHVINQAVNNSFGRDKGVGGQRIDYEKISDEKDGESNGHNLSKRNVRFESQVCCV